MFLSSSRIRLRAVLWIAALLGSLRSEEAWIPAEKVSVVDNRESINPRLAAGADGRFHLVWKEAWTDGIVVASRIGYRENDGRSWLSPRYLSTPGQSANSPGLTVDGRGQPHVVWLERGGSASQFLVAYSTRAPGEDWTPPQRVSSGEQIGFEGRPAVAILPGGDPVAVWADDRSQGNPEVFWSRRTAQGWKVSEPLSTIDEFYSGDVDLKSRPGGGPVVLWLDRRREGQQPFLKVFDQDGWGSPVPFGDPLPSFVNARLVPGGNGRLHFLSAVREGIEVRTAGEDLFFLEPVVLPTAVIYPSFDAVALDDSRLLLAYRDQAARMGVIFSREFSAEGQAFEPLAYLVSEAVVPSHTLSLAIAPGGERHLAWDDLPAGEPTSMVFHSAFVEVVGVRFRRGDVEGRGIDLTDPVALLIFLFLGGAAPSCPAAADANGDGELNLSDPISLLTYLFQSGLPPPAPFPDCGVSISDPLPCPQMECR
jgi:hypothetical protein